MSAFDEGTRGEYRLMKCRTESSVVNGLLVFLRYSLPGSCGIVLRMRLNEDA